MSPQIPQNTIYDDTVEPGIQIPLPTHFSGNQAFTILYYPI